jgi:hypothetical protein
MGITLKALLNLKNKTLHAATHVSMPRRNPDPDAGRDWDHDRDNALRTRVSAAVWTSAHTMIRSPQQARSPSGQLNQNSKAPPLCQVRSSPAGLSSHWSLQKVRNQNAAAR